MWYAGFSFSLGSLGSEDDEEDQRARIRERSADSDGHVKPIGRETVIYLFVGIILPFLVTVVNALQHSNLSYKGLLKAVLATLKLLN